MIKLTVFSAQWCATCKPYKVTLDKLNKQDFEITYIDVDSMRSDEIQNLNIRSIPTTLITKKDSSVIARYAGAMTEQQLIDFVMNNFNKDVA